MLNKTMRIKNDVQYRFKLINFFIHKKWNAWFKSMFKYFKFPYYFTVSYINKENHMPLIVLIFNRI